MITNKGKTALAKYLADSDVQYASHIAIGCGARPRTKLSVAIQSTEASTQNSGDGYAKIITSETHDFQVGDYVKIYNTETSNINNIYVGTWQITHVLDNQSFKFSLSAAQTALQSNLNSPRAILDFSNKTSMDFEAIRVPITDKSTYVENGLSVVELGAEIGSAERYEISEIGIFTDIKDTTSSVNSSNLFDFARDSGWSYHTDTSNTSISFKAEPLDIASVTNTITMVDKVFQANSNNVVFENMTRLLRQERPRNGTNTYFLAGDLSQLDRTGSGTSNSPYVLTPNPNTTGHIEAVIPNSALSFLKTASKNDEIRFGLSIVRKSNSVVAPQEVRVLLEFATQDSTGAATTSYQYARFHAVKLSSEQDLSTNQYVVFSKKIGELQTSSGFDWSKVAFVKIYAQVRNSSGVSDNYYLALDAIRFEYVTSTNPLYALSGYTIIKNNFNLTVSKEPNLNQKIIFKFVVGV